MKSKNIILLVLAVLCAAFITGCLTGCGTDPKRKLPDIQALINLVVPEDFTGSGHWDHHNLYLNFELDATGLRKGPSGKWTWDTLTFKDTNAFWHGEIRYSKDGKPTS